MSLTMLGLRARTMRQLERSGLTTIDALTELSEEALRGNGVDEQAAVDLKTCLKLHGFELPSAAATSSLPDPVITDVLPSYKEAAKDRVRTPERPVDVLPNFAEEVHGGVVDGEQFFEDAEEAQKYADLSDAMFGVDVRKRANKAHTITDAKRAAASAAKALSKQSVGPDVTDDDDRARLLAIFNHPVMDVPEAAWLYGVSRDVIYRAAHKGLIKHRRFGDRIKIFSAPILSELFPDGIK